ncbi:hypothetical protein SERLA73DRAFT_184627 [Serpula lacrymans var. lacrymans S7.3]|uniref:Uncharacterized protein n=2 Tax=Serpula lacrymans var. lacrymans TaxID=341189 RepID=F8Q4S0_SERL3|nr:uncharacterized protein SERLADRAFT_472415 [Serpula lacrymans var. lacrymans S7.9]EGN96547.1 hypothetical protein SERLA73DRAFT_184627 [Serpula lacrymans var. lacrymans S7.3]EGO22088.1 hypothetical protein SERLADRAFT_472415 [Serpula lacrymans var. lacrymans S7.9]
MAPAQSPDIFVADDSQAMVVNGPSNTTTTLSESMQMPHLQWEDPIRSDMGTELSPVAGPSSLAITSETVNVGATTITPPPDWSTFWENYHPEPLSTPIPSVHAQQTVLQWPEPVADPVQADLDLEYFNSGPNPVWDPLTSGEDYFAKSLEQHMQTDVQGPNIPNHEIGFTGPQFQTNGSTEGLSSSSEDVGMQDYLFALFAQR